MRENGKSSVGRDCGGSNMAARPSGLPAGRRHLLPVPLNPVTGGMWQSWHCVALGAEP